MVVYYYISLLQVHLYIDYSYNFLSMSFNRRSPFNRLLFVSQGAPANFETIDIIVPCGNRTCDLSGTDSLLEFENTGILDHSAAMASLEIIIIILFILEPTEL